MDNGSLVASAPRGVNHVILVEDRISRLKDDIRTSVG